MSIGTVELLVQYVPGYSRNIGTICPWVQYNYGYNMSIGTVVLWVQYVPGYSRTLGTICPWVQ